MRNLVESALQKALAEAFNLLKQEGIITGVEAADTLYSIISNLVRKEQRGDDVTEVDYKRAGRFLNTLYPRHATTAVYNATLEIARAHAWDAKEMAAYINHLVRTVQQYDDADVVNDMLGNIRKVLLYNYPQHERARLLIYLDTDVEDALGITPVEEERAPILDTQIAVQKVREIISTYEPPKDIAPDGWDRELAQQFRDVVIDIVEQRVQGNISEQEFSDFLGALVDVVNEIGSTGEKAESEEETEELKKACLSDSSAARDVQESKTERIRRLVQRLLREIRELEEEPAEEIVETIAEEKPTVSAKEKRRIVAYALVDALNTSVMSADGTAEEKEKVKSEIEDFARQLGVPPSRVIFALANYLKVLLIKSIVERIAGGA